MIGNTIPDAVKFMRSLAVQADTDAGGNVFVGNARQSAGYPLVVITVVSKSFTPTQDSGSAVDEIRVQVDTFAKTSKTDGDVSAFELAHTVDANLRAAWSRQTSLGNDAYDNLIDSIQEVGGFEDSFPENDIYQVSTDYIVRVKKITEYMASGTYTPVASAASNLDASPTMSQAQYMQVGNTVTVSGSFTADPTTGAASTSFEISLPVASNFGALEECAGVATGYNGSSSTFATITSSIANDTAYIRWYSSGSAAITFSYIFTYQVI